MDKKKHKLLTVCLGIIIYIVIPILPFIQSPIGIFSKEDATLFLSYYGTIVSGLTGGALTLGGVWWTINDQKKANDQNENLIQQLEDLHGEIEELKKQNQEIIKLLKENNQKNDCVISRIAKKIKK